jgi:hypothetical protein
MIMYCYGALWSYVAIFSSSASTMFFQYALGEECNIYESPSTSCTIGYYGALVIFGTIVIIMAFMDVSEQATLQLILTAYRFLAFLLMAATICCALYYPNPFDSGASKEPPYISHATDGIHWGGFGTIFSFAAVALNVHYNLPDVVTIIPLSFTCGIDCFHNHVDVSMSGSCAVTTCDTK